jgi:hypothetical protein
MPRYFAQIENNRVKQVIVADDVEFCIRTFGGEWAETFPDDPDKNYAGINHIYDPESKNFHIPKPHNGWSMDKKKRWHPPIGKERPEYIGKFAPIWNDKTLDWDYLDNKTGKLRKVALVLKDIRDSKVDPDN